MRRKSATTITTKSGDFVEYHIRLKRSQYERLWDIADDNNVDISDIVRELIDLKINECDRADKKRLQ